MWLISGFSGSARGRGRGSWDLAGAHEGAVAARAGSSGSEVDRATGRLRVRGSAHRSMRTIVSRAVRRRQLVFAAPPATPELGTGQDGVVPEPRRPAVSMDELAVWCGRWLGAPPTAQLFEAGYLSTVKGLRLADGREVVVKVRPRMSRLAGCAA